ncbi:hypothetical protein PIB30_085893 [Stylosanthes scabra]|uniref:Uncharacterized protein n=1 Tax=Stylosanthes scabra TaxID=79078 RepID=A0ABU6RTA8_9FABA|nr:hypothetical protein [Stylosanthes scabra]
MSLDVSEHTLMQYARCWRIFHGFKTRQGSATSPSSKVLSRLILSKFDPTKTQGKITLQPLQSLKPSPHSKLPRFLHIFGEQKRDPSPTPHQGHVWTKSGSGALAVGSPVIRKDFGHQVFGAVAGD